MKLAISIGWVLFALEVVIAGALLVRRPGGDATGSAIARDLGLILVPLLIVVGGLFLWGQRGGPRVAFWAGWTIISLPLILGALSVVSGGGKSLSRFVQKQALSRFDAGESSGLARAIEDSDVDAVRAGIAAGGIDWTARNGYDRTLLSVAVAVATGYGAPPASLDVLRLLLDAGAFPTGAMANDSTLGENNTADALVLAAFGSSNGRPNAVAVLDLLLSAGGNPNARYPDGQPMYFATYRSAESLEVLAKHGADFTGGDPSYESRRGVSPAAWALSEQEWDLALFLLEHGVSPDHDGGNGVTARQVIAELESVAATDPRYRRLKRLVGETPRGGVVKREPAASDSVGR